MAEKQKRLYRSGKDKILGGVCGGVADYFGWDPTLVRIAWVIISLIYGAGVLLYLVCWAIMPLKGKG